MRFFYRMMVYALITSIIEGPAIFILYSKGYPNNPSSDWLGILMIVENAYGWFLMMGRSMPGVTRDTSFDLFYGILSMFIVVSVIGETTEWVYEKVAEMREKKGTQFHTSSTVSSPPT